MGSGDGAPCVGGIAGGAGNGANSTDGNWSSQKMVARLGIGAWNWLSVGAGVVGFAGTGEAGTEGVAESFCVVGDKAGVRETGFGTTGACETRAKGFGNCVVALAVCAGTLENECAASETT